MKSMCLLYGAVVAPLILPSAGSVLMTPAIPYRSIADSPYASQNLSPSIFEFPSNAYYEDFEGFYDGELDDILVKGPGGERVQTPWDGGGGRTSP